MADLTSVHLKHSKNKLNKDYIFILPYLNDIQLNGIETSQQTFQNAIEKLKENLILKDEKYDKESGALFFHKKEESLSQKI